MQNDDFRITPLNNASCDVRWTSAWSSGVSWIFVNGKHKRGPIYADTAERVLKIPLAISEVICLEIHDFPDDMVIPNAINEKPNSRPLIIWNAVSDAARYRIYHLIQGGSESLIYDRAAIDGLTRYEITCPIELDGEGGVWHFFRIEAVDRYGNESTRSSWAYFVADLPAAPTGITVTAGSSARLYDIELEA